MIVVNKYFKYFLAGILLFTPIIASADNLEPATRVDRNSESGLLTWTREADGFSLRLIQLLPDFVRAVYGSHGFPKDEIERIAGYCVFGTIIRNTSNEALQYDVKDWRIIGPDGKPRVPKTKRDWIAEWKRAGIRFSWTLLPDAGTFEVGDWQQGFTTVELPRNTEFDLVYSWSINGQKRTATLKDLRCAPENVSNE